MYNVGIIGCGAILIRHIEAIEDNKNFKLKALCDSDGNVLSETHNKYGGDGYTDYREMIDKSDINFVVVATPNSLHFEQSKYALENGCDVLVEKPVSLNPEEVRLLSDIAESNGRKAYTVLQVRLNPTVKALKKVLDEGVLGEIRGISLTQRWQRPYEYFTGWRSIPMIGGGTLYECGIHYMDVMCHLFGKPKVKSSITYNTKHSDCQIEDTIYSLLDFGKYGGSLEVTISAEPSNVECSIAIMTENAYIKVGGKALDKIEVSKFDDLQTKSDFENVINSMGKSIEPNSYGDTNYQGSCPNHPNLYKNMDDFRISESENVIELIDEIYKLSDIKYY
jgi:predicted dehydrogenase